MRIVTTAQIQKMDREAIDREGIPSTLLMERAAKGFAAAAYELCNASAEKRAAVFCGPGNNGGDGVAASRLLRKAGFQVRTFLVGTRERMTEDCLEMERRLLEMGGCLEAFHEDSEEQRAWCRNAHVVLDAIFGVGLNREIQGVAKTAIAWINESRGKVISADIASGVEADTGCLLGCGVKADVTVTFSFAKPGHFVGKGALHTGKLVVHDIGISQAVKEQCLTMEEYVLCSMEANDVAEFLPERPLDGHKGTFGKVFVLGGSTGFTGAPVFSTRAAVRSGSGLVFAGVPKQIYQIVAGNSEEAMPYPLSCDEDGRLNEDAFLSAYMRMEPCDACLIGPGMGRSVETERLVCRLAAKFAGPLVLDADGLYAIRNHKEILKERARKGWPVILTPHDGEFAYLGGVLGEKDRQDRLGAAGAFAKEYGCILVLKGHRTIVASPEGSVYINTTGNNGMAKGGSGDVLAGIILSLVGQGMTPVMAAASAVWIHGRSGDLCAEDLSVYAMRPMDLIEYLPRVFKELVNTGKEEQL